MCWPRSAPAWWQLTAARDIVATVLVVDDDPRVQRVLHATLAAQSYRVLVAGDGASALGIAVDRKPDLLVLDLDLPDFDGTEVIAGLRGWSTVPIIVLSARDDRDSKVGALDAGADDYVTKPFEMGELLARVRAVLRRRAQPTGTQDEMTIETDAFTVDLVVKKVHTDGVEVHLTPHEWAVLELLVRNPGRLVTQRQLLVHVWSPNHTTESNYLRVYLGQLRRKLERVPAQPRHLLTEPGMGYRFEP
jgi:two-component system KDP operon response regulator KdpE